MLPHQPLALRLNLRSLSLHPRGYGTDDKFHADDTRCLEHLPCLRAQPLELVFNDVPQARWYLDLDVLEVAPQFPPLTTLLEPSLRYEGLDHVDQKERVAIRARVDHLG